MARASRFDCPSSPLAMVSLLRRNRLAVWSALGLALAAHGALSQQGGGEQQASAAKPLTTQFVKRRPRLTKPLELKKRPRPKRRRLERSMVAVKAKLGARTAPAGLQMARVVGRLARPRIGLGRLGRPSAEVVEPQALAGTIAGEKDAKDVVDMSLELLDQDALDTGRYQAMVIQDPADKRNVKGYLHLAMAYPFSVQIRTFETDNRLINGLRRLIARLNEWTELKASIERRITFDSAEFLQTPWVYLSISFSMEPTQGEIENLGRYLLGGGFFFFEGNNWGAWQGEKHLVRFVTSALNSQGYRQGVQWELQSLPDSHPILHCYYDFDDGVPVGHSVVIKYHNQTGRDDDVLPWCRGVEIGGRLVAFNTNQQYVFAWSDWGHLSPFPNIGNHYIEYDPTLQFRFGINTILFALTQEGSITRRVMEPMR